ncbi:flagellar filament capping protein FliD [Idiomarina sp. HP20-50]|uniref:flagellar filament capping protein FliD n=1 Tax=Idiomarina sp. HP20-50 TaxID=3070813 RepID=UPI00294AD2D2|nr:flagellar filament capping protein FliD [Idiomarina sp. HP20-50]MDV6316973.1 flagellar filament capping protein FliD [Idiomarina sp. HP20-50]
MPLFTSAGVGSGLDLEAIISSTLQATNQPQQAKFQRQESQYETELSALGAVKSALSKFDDVVNKLSDSNLFDKRVANLTQPESGDLIRFSSNDDSGSGSFAVEVLQLAKGSRAVSAGGSFASSDQIVNTAEGTLSFAAGDKSFDLTIAADSTLEDIRQQINDSADNFGVTANIINTGTEAKLVFNSNVSGVGNDLTVTNDNAELDALSTQAFGGGAGGMAIAVNDQATDAQIEIDGILATSSTNTFTDVIQGSTITAVKESENNETAQVEIARDREGVSKLIDEFVQSYNAVVDIMDKATAFDPKTGNSAVLNADSTMRNLKNQMVNVLTSNVDGAGDFSSLFDIGLSLNKDGKLEKNNLVRSVNEAMDQDFNAFGKIFSNENGVASRFEGLMDNYIESRGAITFREDSLTQRLDRLEEDRLDHSYRMQQLESRLREKYSGLDVMLAQMQSTQSFLSAQLGNLPGFGGKD